MWDLIRGIEFQVVSVLFNGPISASALTPTSLDPISSLLLAALTVLCHLFPGNNEGKPCRLSRFPSPTSHAIIRNFYDFAASAATHAGAIEDIDFSPREQTNRYRRKWLSEIVDDWFEQWGSSIIHLSTTKLGKVGQLSNIITTSPQQAIARSVSFFDQGSSVFVSYLELHEV